MTRKRDEPVRLTRIYTRAGDAGQTSLGDGSRVSEDRSAHPGVRRGRRSEFPPGLALATPELPEEFRPWLQQVQNDLFDLGADLSVPLDDERERLARPQEQVDRLEELCDLVNARLEPLKSFVLPGGGRGGRPPPCGPRRLPAGRAGAVSLSELEDANPVALAYLNRLSDLLFILARAAAQGDEPLWKPGELLPSGRGLGRRCGCCGHYRPVRRRTVEETASSRRSSQNRSGSTRALSCVTGCIRARCARQATAPAAAKAPPRRARPRSLRRPEGSSSRDEKLSGWTVSGIGRSLGSGRRGRGGFGRRLRVPSGRASRRRCQRWREWRAGRRGRRVGRRWGRRSEGRRRGRGLGATRDRQADRVPLARRPNARRG